MFYDNLDENRSTKMIFDKLKRTKHNDLEDHFFGTELTFGDIIDILDLKSIAVTTTD